MSVAELIQLRFLSGPNHLNKKLEADKFIERHARNHELLLTLAEQISQDRRSELSADDVPQTFDSWADERGLNNRGLYELPSANPHGHVHVFL